MDLENEQETCSTHNSKETLSFTSSHNECKLVCFYYPYSTHKFGGLKNSTELKHRPIAKTSSSSLIVCRYSAGTILSSSLPSPPFSLSTAPSCQPTTASWSTAPERVTEPVLASKLEALNISRFVSIWKMRYGWSNYHWVCCFCYGYGKKHEALVLVSLCLQCCWSEVPVVLMCEVHISL